MDPMAMLMTLGGSLLYRLPLLLVLGAGAVLLAGVAPGPERRQGALGLALLAVGTLLGVLLAIVPMLLLADGGNLARMGLVMGACGFVVSLVEAAGVLLLVLPLVRALRRPAGA
jgi:hypothetical protein